MGEDIRVNCIIPGYVAQSPAQNDDEVSMRKQRGLTQAELARRLGITRQAVTALELRPETATFERLMKVWAVLGLEVSLRARAVTADALEW